MRYTGDGKSGWIPLFFWIIINGVTWAAANNMLEKTMSIFVSTAFLCYLNSSDGKRQLWIALAVVSLSFGILTKGFFCLYMWSVPFFMMVFKRDKTLLQMTIDNSLLVFLLFNPLLCCTLLFLLPKTIC